MAMQSEAIFDLPGQVSANAAAGIAQYAACVADPAGNPFDMIYPSGTGAFALGVCQSVGGPPVVGGAASPVNTSGESITVRLLGVTKALAAAAITAGSYVQVSGTTGQVASVALAPALGVPNPSLTPTAAASASGGSLATGNYTIGYQYTNAAGQSQMSPASTPIAVTGPTGSIVTVALPALPANATGVQWWILSAPSGNIGPVGAVQASGAAFTLTAQPGANTLPPVVSTSGAASNTYVLGYALTGATGAGDLVTVLLLPGLTTQVTA